eukprot:6477700-Amphidinium_carterae.1
MSPTGRLLSSFGLDLLTRMLFGPQVDRATLQLWHRKKKSKGAFRSKLNKQGTNARILLAFRNHEKLNENARRRWKLCDRKAMLGLVTILCHAECLGAWASFWAPCRGMWPFEYKFHVLIKRMSTDKGFAAKLDLVSRGDICNWRWRVNRTVCMEATLEHLVRLLNPKFAHYTFTVAAFRIVKGRFKGNGNAMTLADAHVLLKFLWLV